MRRNGTSANERKRPWSHAANSGLLVNRREILSLLDIYSRRTEEALAAAINDHERRCHPIRHAMKLVQDLVAGRHRPASAPIPPEGYLTSPDAPGAASEAHSAQGDPRD